MAKNILLCCILAVPCALVVASDPAPLQDFCVADPDSQVLVNGVACLDPKLMTANNCSLSELNMPGNVSNPQGSVITLAVVEQIPGLNTLGISLGCCSSASSHRTPDNKLITKVLKKGDVFVFLKGLIHFQQNVGYGNTFSFAGLSSQNPGVVLVPDTVFRSTPHIATDVLAKAFQVDKAIVERMEAKF